jgi:asparagine synthase (glutamine-hydrolysing)
LAFETELPDEIITRRAKGNFEEHIRQILGHNRAFVRELLTDGELVGQGLLDRQRLMNALADGPSPARSGNLELLDCLSVEAWARSWKSPKAGA